MVQDTQQLRETEHMQVCYVHFIHVVATVYHMSQLGYTVHEMQC